MPHGTTITHEQLLAVYIATEHGGKVSDTSDFSFAGLAGSTYSFGVMQFDVGSDINGTGVKRFLKGNGFNDADICDLGRHGGLSRERLDVLDAKLRLIPQAKVNEFTDQQLDGVIGRVNHIIGTVREKNPVAADAIVGDTKLQLGIADYVNQFGPKHDGQLADFLAGKSEFGKYAGNPPTRNDVQSFIGMTPYGRNPANARGVAGREAHFNMAMAELGLGPAVEVAGHSAAKAGDTLRYGDRGTAVHDLQTKLAELGYADRNGHTLKADGDFGPATRDAVERFQNERGLAAKGKVDSVTWLAIRADMQMLRRDDPGLLPAVAAMSSLPAAAPGPDDPRNALNPNHALFNELKYRLPDASDNRLLQFTSACHAQGITDKNLTAVRFDQQNGIVSFGATNDLFVKVASVDVKEPSPPAMQSVQHIQQFDQQQVQLQENIRAQIAQTNAQAQPGPVLGGR